MLRKNALNLTLAAGSTCCLLLAFPPADMGALAFVALAPWLLLISRERLGTSVCYSVAIGAFFFLVSISWLRYVTYAAWISLSLTLACFFGIFGACVHYLYHRFRVPLTLACPLAWTANEFVRSFFLTGFPWFYLAHTQYKNLPFIQLADTTGAYGITFVMASCNAVIVDVLLSILHGRKRVLCLGLVAWVAFLVCITHAYGRFRLDEYRPKEGPLICLVQGNVPQDLKMESSLESSRGILKDYERISLLAKGKQKDLVVWPETMAPGFINFAALEEKERYNDDLIAIAEESEQTLGRLTEELQAPLLVGVQIAERDNHGKWGRYNSAVLFDSDFFTKWRDLAERYSLAVRYDKIHLVPFGEYTPLKRWFPFLAKLVPYEVGFRPGGEATVFLLGKFRFGVLICYEDTIPPVVRQFKKDKDVDFMINISNDGWFRGSAELEEHLAISVFRAIENRIGLARAANTGISSFIAPTGKIEGVVGVNGKCKEVEGILIRRVSLDDRHTFYTAHGEISGLVCLVGLVIILAVGAVKQKKIFS